LAACEARAQHIEATELAAGFRRDAERFRSAGPKARADFFFEPDDQKDTGYWRLRFGPKEPESAWVSVKLLASSAIRELGIPPAPNPRAGEIEAKPDTSKELSVEPAAIDSCTNAWLHFLRRQSLRSGSLGYQHHKSGGALQDVWEASALQCERSEQERIQTALEKTGARPEAVDQAKKMPEHTPDESSWLEGVRPNPVFEGVTLQPRGIVDLSTLKTDFRWRLRWPGTR
jgi:hypothetical protein